MRVTFGTKYNQMANNQGALSEKLNKTNAKIASGLKIQNGYDDASVFNQDLKYQYDSTTLGQGKDISQSALNSTISTDKALNEISKAMTLFKTKMLAAANEVHTPTSREAIARDLEAIKQHIISIGNTSIGGSFIFAGSKVDIKPFDESGNYYGNNEDLKALISSQNEVPFNITGKDLFFGQDNDKHKIITTNNKLFNQSFLHPAVMNKTDKHIEPQEVYIKESDTLRDLVGDNDNNASNNKPHIFYIQGTKSTGESFKSKIKLDTSYTNKESATTIKDLLDKIGNAYGNTNQTQVVDVRLNNWGQIEIKDIKNGKSSLDFHMVSSDADVENLKDLQNSNQKVISYTTRNMAQDFGISSIKGVGDKYDNRITKLPTTLIKNDNTMPERNTKLEDVLPTKTRYLVLTGTPPNTKDGKINKEVLGTLSQETPNGTPFLLDTKGKSIEDLMDSIKKYFGGNLDVELDRGEIRIYDKNVRNKSKDTYEPPFDGERGFSINIEGFSEDMQKVDSFRPLLGGNYTQTNLRKQGSKLSGSVAQIVANSSKIASGDTKLVEVSTGSLNNKTYNLNIRDHNGIELGAKIHFNEQGSFLELPAKSKDQSNFLIPLFNPKDEPPAVTISKADDVTYKQLMDAMSIALNYSNEDSKQYLLAQISGAPTQDNKKAYEDLILRANERMHISLNKEGKLEVKDNIRSNTRMEVSFFDKSTDDFSPEEIKNSSSQIKLNSNGALVIDDPNISFFKGLDEAIASVRDGINRAGELNDMVYSSQMDNKGIQNSITLIDHLSDHVEKIISKNGAHGRSFESAITRNEVIKTQVDTLKSDTIGADIAETYNHFTNLSNNYQAVLSSTNKINQMSLVDYIR